MCSPTGELRFAPSQPPTPWVEPRDASNLGPKCIQLAESATDPSTEGSEDCLQLNVWTPQACSGADQPVMFFIHGGGNATGSGVATIGGFAGPIYDIGDDPYLDIDVPNLQSADLRGAQCDFWDQWIP